MTSPRAPVSQPGLAPACEGSLRDPPADDLRLSRNYSVDLRLLGLSERSVGARVLDVGCGAGRHELAATQLPITTVACDLSAADLRDGRFFVGEAGREQSHPGLVTWLQADGRRLPFPDATFDALICSETLEHLPDDLAALLELRRVARPGATLAVSVPTYWPELVLWTLSWRITHTPGGHVRIYRLRDLHIRLCAAGWRPFASRRRHAFETVYWLLGALTGGGDPPAWPARWWRTHVTAPENAGSPALTWAEGLANPWLAKSVVLYARAV
ncbi:MAG TPA: methyltransferase domain-containing protein [Tepidiformaceae bacterium]|nr:methyltransferase domain-containing protein [Tepidiformaceae bacterium]